MPYRPTFPANLIFAPGTRVVVLRDILDPAGNVSHARGTVASVVRQPQGHDKGYRLRFLDGVEAILDKREFVLLSKYKAEESGYDDAADCDLYEHVIYRCVIGSRAYGLDDTDSDTDRRGIYVPPADMHWSLYGVPEQLENPAREEVYWEIQKFLVLALKANPNVLECLYTPVVERVTPLAQELLDLRDAFLSKLIYQTYNGYVLSQFKRMQAHLRNHGEIKWKHVMHLIRLLLAGIHLMRTGTVEANLVALNETARLPHINELIERKQLGEEKERLSQVDLKFHESEYERLSAELKAARESSQLPEKPRAEVALHDLLVRLRLASA